MILGLDIRYCFMQKIGLGAKLQARFDYLKRVRADAIEHAARICDHQPEQSRHHHCTESIKLADLGIANM